MNIKVSGINKAITYILFIAAFFMQSYVDGYYIARGYEPFNLKVLKYCLVAAGIVWGFLQVFTKKRFVFLKELRNVLIAIFTFFAVSMVLILAQNGDLAFCLELLMRYAMSVLYAFVLLNTIKFEDVYNLMVFFLVISIYGWFLQKGEIIFNLSYYKTISFEDSYSPFESHYFAPSAMNCCAFFMYYRKNKWTQIVSFLFAIMTFKRVQLLFAVCMLVLPRFVDVNRNIKKTSYIGFCVGVVFMTICYYYLLQPEFEWIIEGITGQTANRFTSGRSALLRELLQSNYVMGGLGTSEAILGRGIEMELISIMLEMSFPVMVLFVFCYASVAGRKRYSILVMLYLMVLLMTGSGLYNVFMWTTAFLFFGSINYLRTENFKTWKKRRENEV